MSINLTHMNSLWTNQLEKITGRAKLEAIDPNIIYSDGTQWYDHIENIRVVNPETGLPRASLNVPNDNDRISDRYVEDGSYVRLKNIT